MSFECLDESKKISPASLICETPSHQTWNSQVTKWPWSAQKIHDRQNSATSARYKVTSKWALLRTGVRMSSMFRHHLHCVPLKPSSWGPLSPQLPLAFLPYGQTLSMQQHQTWWLTSSVQNKQAYESFFPIMVWRTVEEDQRETILDIMWTTWGDHVSSMWAACERHVGPQWYHNSFWLPAMRLGHKPITSVILIPYTCQDRKEVAKKKVCLN